MGYNTENGATMTYHRFAEKGRWNCYLNLRKRKVRNQKVQWSRRTRALSTFRASNAVQIEDMYLSNRGNRTNYRAISENTSAIPWNYSEEIISKNCEITKQHETIPRLLIMKWTDQ